LRLKKTDLIFVLVAASVVGGLFVLSMIGRQAKPMPATPDHAVFTRETKRAECLPCHEPNRPGAVAPLSESHPRAWMKEQQACTTCHDAPSPPPRGEPPK
jgi:hypothetical protein